MKKVNNINLIKNSIEEYTEEIIRKITLLIPKLYSSGP